MADTNRNALDADAKHVGCHIVQHRMAEVRGERLWAEACFGNTIRDNTLTPASEM